MSFEALIAAATATLEMWLNIQKITDLANWIPSSAFKYYYYNCTYYYSQQKLMAGLRLKTQFLIYQCEISISSGIKHYNNSHMESLLLKEF